MKKLQITSSPCLAKRFISSLVFVFAAAPSIQIQNINIYIVYYIY